MTTRRTGQGRRGGKPLSRERIVASATRLVKRGGSAALSMRALAGELGVAAPSLYWHFRTREELVAEIVRSMMEGLPVADPGGAWTDRVREHAHAIRNGVFARPELLDLLRDATSATAQLAPLGLRFLQLLEEAGFGGAACVRGARLLSWQVWGFILHEARLGWPRAEIHGREAAHVYAFPLSALSGHDLDRVSHLLPHLTRLDAQELFELALDAVVARLSAELTEDPS